MGYTQVSAPVTDTISVFSLLQGNLYEFLKLTGWRGSRVLYFGDHIYSDLAVRGSPLS